MIRYVKCTEKNVHTLCIQVDGTVEEPWKDTVYET